MILVSYFEINREIIVSVIEIMYSFVVLFFSSGVWIRVYMVEGMVRVLLGMFDIKVMVVLNLSRERVKVSIVLIIIFGKVSGNVIVKKTR